jgi:DNA repair protein SbcC/Rad50
MKIRMENIKCYQDRTFDLGDSGLSLVSGQSGKGKSSIIQAIHFALFGVGSKITSYGATSCKVTLDFDGLTVVRSKGPGKLVARCGDDAEVEGDEAQAIINRKFGEAFDVTGYIPQNAVKSFILMSATDKLSFLETFAFRGTDLIGMKQRCKDHIQEAHTSLTESTAKLEAAIEMFQEIEEPEFVEFPINVKNNNYTKAASNERVRLDNTKIMLRQSRELLSECQLQNVTATANNKQIEDNLSEIEILETQIKNIDTDLSQISLPEDVESYRLELANIVSNRDLASSQKQLGDMRHYEDQSRFDKLEEATRELWLTYDEDEAVDTIKSFEELLVDSNRVNKLKTRLKTLSLYDDPVQLSTELEGINSKLHNLRVSKESHSCPKCTTRLRFVDGLLAISGAKSEEDVDEAALRVRQSCLSKEIPVLSELQEIIDSYDDPIPTPSEITEDLVYFKDYLSDNRRNDKLRVDLGTSTSYSKAFMELQKKVDSAVETREARAVDAGVSSGLTEEELRSVISVAGTLESEVSDLQSRRRRVESTLNRYKSKNAELGEHVDVDIFVTYESDLVEKISGLELKLEKHIENLEIIGRWEVARKQLSVFNDWNDKIKSRECDEACAKSEYAASLLLKDKILEAESIAMMNLVSSINLHAKVYLDDFFEEDPIVVTLQAFKRTKTGVKPQISMDIEYKGMECDLQMLSGGEMSRIVLAYTLALAEMFNSPLLLLDECTSSLDQDTTDHVFDSIQENFNGKLTVIVAHQVVTGIFDTTINLQ